MDLKSNFEVSRVADFILSHNFTRVALQFPDELLKDSSSATAAVRHELRERRRALPEDSGGSRDAAVKLYVMADTAYGSCCVDEVGASHVNAQCVVHYGHTCLSPTTSIPALCIFGKSSISATHCVETLCDYAVKNQKPILVLFGLEYAHAMQDIKAHAMELALKSGFDVHYADVVSSLIIPSKHLESKISQLKINGDAQQNGSKDVVKYKIGGLTWDLHEGFKMEDYVLFWIGADDSAFGNVVLTFNNSVIVRYDAIDGCLISDVSNQRRILKRRYYLVEKAKDANIVGILVGTLGVAGYLHMINQIKELVSKAGKKSYTFVMGKPNPAKLANFPECDVFIYVSCAETALLDSKEFLAPIITPFEAVLAFSRGSIWSGTYSMDFQDVIASPQVNVIHQEEARFSFLQGGYVEDLELQEDNDEKDGVLAAVNDVRKALQPRNKEAQLTATRGNAKSGAEYLVARSFQGLEIQTENNLPEPYLIGRTGRASGYVNEKTK